MNLLNLEDEKLKTEKIKGHKFTFRFMSPKDRVMITQKRMALQNGNPVESMSDTDFIFFENIAIVDVCVEEMPDNFNMNESCLNWDDIGLINELADAIRKHTLSLEAKLKKNKPIEGGAEK